LIFHRFNCAEGLLLRKLDKNQIEVAMLRIKGFGPIGLDSAYFRFELVVHAIA